jgi:cobalt-zinc-cadmium resistance protein CzcA
MSLGALDFGLIVDGAIIIAENCLRQLADHRQRLGRGASAGERLRIVAEASREVIQPTVYGQAVIVMVYVPLLGFTGVEGKTFLPMALTVIIALTAAFVLSLTFVPAMLAVALCGNVQEGDNWFVLALRRAYGPLLTHVIGRPAPVIGAAVVLIRRRGMGVHTSWAGIRADSGRKEHRHGGEENPERLARTVAGDAVCQ